MTTIYTARAVLLLWLAVALTFPAAVAGATDCNCAGFCDLNLDGGINPTDVIIVVNYIYRDHDNRELLPECPRPNGDWDIDSLISPLDVTYYVKYVYKGVSSGPADPCGSTPEQPAYVLVETGQVTCFDDFADLACPSSGAPFSGQDAQYDGNQPAYLDHGNGTVTDLNTGLMWQQTPELENKSTWAEAIAAADTFNLAGYTDWRLPSIKELYSLILFSGVDISGWSGLEGAVPFVDTNYFDFAYGDESAGERLIDAQYWSSTEYVSTTMDGNATAFGVNFADGRIKGYPTEPIGPPGYEFTKTSFVRYVRENSAYAVNNFADNGDGTVTDSATGLMWMQIDSGQLNAGDNSDGALNWQQALAWAENLDYAGYTDWRLPNAKELQSIVDYTRSPATTSSAAIDPIFSTTAIIDEGGQTNCPFYWTGTTHKGGSGIGEYAVYLSFGEALGYMETPPGSGIYALQDVHGAGAQRSDPKSGDPADYPLGHGPQGDVVRIYNFVRCVRDLD